MTTLPGLLNAPWAISPEMLTEIQEVYATHLRGERIDIPAIEARLGRTLANEQKAYGVQPGGVGVLEASGVMAPKANILMQVSGGISTGMLTKQIESMHGDPRVQTALIVADSPGGSVFGLPAAVDALRALAADKPTVVVGQGTVASAMYWLASAANALFIEGQTDVVGSIGVVMRMGWDKPKDNEIQLVRGKYKRPSTDGIVPSPHALAQAEDQLDYLYALLVDAVAQHRGVDTNAVLDRMADGRTFVGGQAIDAGLVDGYSTVDAMVERLATNPKEFAARRKAVFAMPRKSSATASASTAAFAHSQATLPEGKTMSAQIAVTPPQQLAAPPRTKDEWLTAAAAHSEKSKLSLTQSLHELGYDASEAARQITPCGSTRMPAASAVQQAARAATADRAKAVALERGISFVDALKRCQGEARNAGGTVPVVGHLDRAGQAVAAKRYAEQHELDFVDACKALGVGS